MLLGIGSYTCTWAIGVPGRPPRHPLGARDLLARARSLGVRVVQYCDNLPLTALPPRELEGLLEEARAAGIAVEVGTRGLDEADLRANLAIAIRAGAPFVRVVVDGRGREPSPAEAAALLRPLLPEFEAAGVRIAIENHDRFPARALAGLVEELGRHRAGVCLDTVNSLGALEGPEAVVGTLAPYALNLHLKDFAIRRVESAMGFVVEGRPAGAGRLDVPWLLGKIRKAGRDVNAIVELWTPPAATLEETIEREEAWAEESVRNLRKHISG